MKFDSFDLNTFLFSFRSSQQPDKLQNRFQKAARQKEKTMDCIIGLLVTLFEVIQDTGTGT
jgi:hypothetical protein